MAGFDPTTDSWARGDPIPIIGSNTPFAPDVTPSLLKGGASDLNNNVTRITNSANTLRGSFTPGTKTPGGADVGPEGLPRVPVIANKAAETTRDAGGLASTAAAIVSTLGGGSKVAGGVADIGTAAQSFMNVDWAAWFVRIAVMVLGFIFVAVGLAMLGVKSPVGQTVVSAVAKKVPRK